MFAYIMCGDCSVYLANQCQCPFWRLVSLGGLHHYLVHYNHRIMALLRTILRKPTKVPAFIWEPNARARKTNGHCFNIRCHLHHDHSVHLRQYCMIRFFMVKAICTSSLIITLFWIKILMLGGKI